MNRKRIKPDFFKRNPVVCARDLLGCVLYWEDCSGVIIETEAYSAAGDEACHTFFRPSAREFVQKHQPGVAYVYLNYGMHWLLNFLVKDGQEEGFVLIRALRPRAGMEKMRARNPAAKPDQICAGPGRLTRALGINGSAHGLDIFAMDSPLSLHPGPPPERIETTPRIGISKATDLLWRFVAADI